MRNSHYLSCMQNGCRFEACYLLSQEVPGDQQVRAVQEDLENHLAQKDQMDRQDQLYHHFLLCKDRSMIGSTMYILKMCPTWNSGLSRGSLLTLNSRSSIVTGLSLIPDGTLWAWWTNFTFLSICSLIPLISLCSWWPLWSHFSFITLGSYIQQKIENRLV